MFDMEDFYGDKKIDKKKLSIFFEIVWHAWVFFHDPIPFCSTRISKVGKCAAFQLWTPTYFYALLSDFFPFFLSYQNGMTFFSHERWKLFSQSSQSSLILLQFSSWLEEWLKKQRKSCVVRGAAVMASAPLLPPFDHLVSKTELHFPLDDDCEAWKRIMALNCF